MEKVYKGIMGYKLETEKNDATHVVLTFDELDKLESAIKTLKARYDVDVNNLKQEMVKVSQNANKSLTKAQYEYENQIQEKDTEIERLNSLNQNLLRISKERSNAKRGLTPKKKHNGYVLLDSTEYLYSVSISRRPLKMNVWKVRVQSFYDATIPFETIKENLEKDLIQFLGGSLGVSAMYLNGKVDAMGIDALKKLFSDSKRFIFKTSYKQNFRSGYWEVEYLVNRSINVPDSMLLSK